MITIARQTQYVSSQFAILLAADLPPQRLQDGVGRHHDPGAERLVLRHEHHLHQQIVIVLVQLLAVEADFPVGNRRQQGRAGRCWGKQCKSGRMACAIHLSLEPGETPVCVSNCNSSFVTMKVMKRPSPMSSPSTRTTNASNISD